MQESYRFGSYRLDIDARRLTRSGTPVSITLRGFDLLLVLVRNAGKAVPRSRLLEEVWRDVVVEEGNLDTHISTLRKALAEAPGAIETVRGFGYRFSAEIDRETPPTGVSVARRAAEPALVEGSKTPDVDPGEPPTAKEAAVRALSTASRSPVPPDELARSRRPTAARLALGAAALAIVAAVGGVFVAKWIHRALGSPIRAEPPVAGLRSLAVLPFENLSRSADDAWLASALREVLSSEAARSGAVSALPGETVTRFAAEIGMPAGATLPGAAVAKFRARLGVDLLLAGTYLVVGPTHDLRVDFQLYDAVTGSSRKIWSESGKVDELLALVARTGDELRGELGPGSVAASASTLAATSAAFPASSDALRLYTSGLAELRRDRPNAALDLFQQAVLAQPQFALARGALASVLGQLGRERDARTEAKRALELASGLPEVDRLDLQGRLYALTNQWAQAVAVRREQVRRDPTSLDLGLELARALIRANQPAEAIALLESLAAMPPPKGADPRIDLERGWAARFASDFEGMKSAGDRTVSKGRALGSDLIVAEGLVLVSWADLTLNRWKEGLVACEEGMKIAARLEHPFLVARHQGLCGWSHLNLGELDESEKDFRSALAAARANGDLDQSTDFLYGLSMVVGNRGRVAEGRDLDAQQLEIAREAGDSEAEVQALGGLAAAQADTGELEAAEATAREGLALARKVATPGRISNAIATLASIRATRGANQEAIALFREAIEQRRQSTPARAGLLSLEVGWAELNAGEPESALAEASNADALLAVDDELARVRLAALRADALARLGRRSEAEKQLATVEVASRGMGWGSGNLGGLDLARAAILDRLGRGDEAAAIWRDVAKRPELAELVGVRLETSYNLARQRAANEGSAGAKAELLRVTAEARKAKFGALIGEEL